MKKIFLTIGCIMIAIFSVLGNTVPSYSLEPSAKSSKRIVKVGYPIQDGLTMKDENGNYYGYMYDYLKELSQYTGWSYEFVEVKNESTDNQLTKLIEMLQTGEIDMLGGMRYSEQLAKLFDYPTESYGNAYSVLAIKEDNDKLDSYTLGTTKDLKVALNKTSTSRNEKWEQYAQNNGIKYTAVYYDDVYQQIEAVENAQADAWVSVDIGLEKGFRSIARFSPDPMYFAVSKGKSDIVHELNNGMEELNQVNSALMQTLYLKYFDQKSENVILTQQEKEYISSCNTLKVMALKEQAPIQFSRDNKPQGTAIDILNKISQKTGLKFTYEVVDTYDEYIKKLNETDANILAGINYDYSINKESSINVTTAYMEAPLQMVLGEKINVNELSNKKLAIRKELSVTLEDRTDASNIIYYDSTKECLEAVEQGKADYCIDGTYAISYYMNQDSYHSLISVADITGAKLSYSFGIAQSDDHLLVGILNKCIRNFSQEEINSYIFQHATEKGEFTLTQYMEQHVVETTICAVVIIILIIATFAYFYQRQSKMKRQIEVENSRYRMLGKITQEIIFEYDYEKDILNLGGKKSVLSEASEINDYKKHVSEKYKDDESSLFHCIMEKKDTDHDVFLYLTNGERRWYHIVMKVVYDLDEPVYAIGRLIDIQEEKLEREKLEKESTIDALTSIYNASTIKKVIKNYLDTHTEGYAFGILDLDYFKQVNDEYGHFTGDKVLTHCAKAMRESFGDDSYLGRLGGDEFIIFIPRYPSKEHLEKCCMNMQEQMSHVMKELPLTTVSIGFILNTQVHDFDLLYQWADKVLYEVKDSGRNNYRISEMDE